MIFKIELVHDGHVRRSWLIDPLTPVTNAQVSPPETGDGVRVRGFRFYADAYAVPAPSTTTTLANELRDVQRRVPPSYADVIDRAIQALEAMHDG